MKNMFIAIVSKKIHKPKIFPLIKENEPINHGILVQMEYYTAVKIYALTFQQLH